MANDFKVGDIAYWCKIDTLGNYAVCYGVVDDVDRNMVYIDILESMERRLINGIPIDEFESEETWHKIPKKSNVWSDLFTQTYAPVLDESIDIEDADSLLHAYEKGWLVKSSSIFHGVVEPEITKDGYRLVKKPSQGLLMLSVALPYSRCYHTYDGANNEGIAFEVELERQRNMSDYDWSVEQIDKTLATWRRLDGVDDTMVFRIRDWLLALDNVEDVVVRLFCGCIQWRYEKNKKWRDIEL